MPYIGAEVTKIRYFTGIFEKKGLVLTYIGAEVTKIRLFAGIFEKKGLAWTYIGAKVSKIGHKNALKAKKMPKTCQKCPILARKSVKFAIWAEF